MTTQKAWEISLNILQIVVLIAVIAIRVRKTGKSKSLFAAFFTFAMVSLALEDIYWIAYDFLRPDTWMPFAADEIAGSAAILLLGSALSTKLKPDAKGKITELLFSFLFMAGCAGLWIAWSGEWFQDIVFALPYVYFLYVLIRGLRSTRALKTAETYAAIVICAAIIALDVIGLYVSEEAAELIYNINYVILNGTTILLFIKTLRGRNKQLFLSFALFLWTRLVLYMSSGLFYNIGLFLHTLTFLLMLHAVDREESLLTPEENGGMP